MDRTIPLPSFKRNDRKFGANPCYLCGRQVDPKHDLRITVADGGNSVLRADLADDPQEARDGGFMGSWTIGPECAKKLPKAYVTGA